MKNGTGTSKTAELGIDYSQHAFTKNYEPEENAGLFPVNFIREFVPGVKRLKQTNRWNVTMLEPQLGICSFYLIKNGRNYVADKTGLPKGAKIPGQETISWCSAELTAHLL